MPRTLTAAHALVPAGFVRDVAVDVADDGRILAVRSAERRDGPVEPGILLPGLTNAHTHLELGWAAGQVPGGEGLAAWVARLGALGRPPATPIDVSPLVDTGTAVVCDVSNGGDTGPTLAAAGLAGVVAHELLGMRPEVLADRLAAAALPERRFGAITVRPSPHGVYSTPAPLIRATCRPSPSGAPATIHVGEDPAEAAFTLEGGGPIAAWMDSIGIAWRVHGIPGATPIALLDALGVLGPDLLLVHGVHLTADDRARIASRGATVCLCPRSNLHIGGVLPDVGALLAAGVPLCLGTDSLGSSPDLDVLGEIPVLARAHPELPVAALAGWATSGGARALRVDRGTIAVGRSPGLVRVRAAAPDELREHAPPRVWEVRP